MTKPNQDNDTILDEIWDKAVDELVGWNYGTVYKGYDNEETAETLEEDTRKYLDKLKIQIKTHYISRDKVREAIDSSEKVWKGKPADRFDEKGMYTKTTELREKLGL